MGLTAVGAALAALEAIIDSAAAADGCKTGCAMRVSNLFKILKYGEKVRRGKVAIMPNVSRIGLEDLDGMKRARSE